MSLLRRHAQPLVAYATFILLGAMTAMAVAVYCGYEGSLISFSSRRIQALFLAGVVGSVVSLAGLLYALRVTRGRRQAQFWVPMASSVVVALLIFGAAEAALRVVAEPTLMGQRVGPLELIPYDWDRVRALNRSLGEDSQRDSAYFVADPQLGWTVGAGRESRNGLYLSSAGGVRSARRGEDLRAIPAHRRIGMFGDSFVFSEEVAFEDSLGRALDDALPEGYRTVNFGVPGYGVDQAYLRFREAIQDWPMPVALYGFIADDLFRAESIYVFLKSSWQTPFSKPRFLVRNGDLTLINSPALSPDEMFSRASIFDLPYLEHDRAFFAHYWQDNLALGSYVARLLVSSFPRYPELADLGEVSDLGARIIERFAVDAEARGVSPLVVYFPSRGDFEDQDRRVKDRVLERLAEREIDVIDLSTCIASGDEHWQWVFIPGGVHYSRRGNEAAAACLSPVLMDLLEERRSDGSASVG